MSTKTYNVPTISCGHCTATIERELKFVDGVEAVKAELDSKQVTVEVENDDVLTEVEKMLEEIGYPAA
ncbi:MAG: heavy-metal-associated domain-containing protein [Caldilineaceae bacterium]|jgi:copper chaperone|nr:heavy-metal-associated domain-containing protein [Caldilineaceae bacterium]